jgi:hypothetical protein
MNHLAKTAGLLRVCASVFVVGIIIGCSSTPNQGDPSWTLVPITDLNMVVGEWEP